MFGLLNGLVGAAVKTVVLLPVSMVADVIKMGGELPDKGGQSYTGDAIDSINRSIEEAFED